ncbi:MAG: hypothetical protein B7Y90_06085 [Alphaproteobacteria bacterium 32-64-14]|nr:MAG: hypothetical protein B7Y90_06085 [Alphaproteobacteria bacterium 32-64-14]
MRIAALATSAFAAALMASPALALTVETKMSTAFQEKLDDDIGVREARVLSDALTRKITNVFAEKGVQAEKIVVTIEDARPNRPTMEQVSQKPGLDSMHSISLGGAKLSGIAYDAAGNEIGRFDYRWYETDLHNVVAATTWSDARSTFDKFARRFADKLT